MHQEVVELGSLRQLYVEARGRLFDSTTPHYSSEHLSNRLTSEFYCYFKPSPKHKCSEELQVEVTVSVPSAFEWCAVSLSFCLINESIFLLRFLSYFST